MKIPGDEVVSIPATEQKEYPDLFISRMVIDFDSTESGRVVIITKPYNYETKEIYGSPNPPIETDRIWQAANEVTEIGAAFVANMAAIKPLKNWIESRSWESSGDLEELSNSESSSVF